MVFGFFKTGADRSAKPAENAGTRVVRAARAPAQDGHSSTKHAPALALATSQPVAIQVRDRQTTVSGATTEEEVLAVANGSGGRSRHVVAPSGTVTTEQPPADSNRRTSRELHGLTAVASSIEDLRRALPTWRGDWIIDVVAPEAQKGFAVLWLGLGAVALIGTPDSLHSAHGASVRAKLKNDYFLEVRDEIRIGADLISALLESAFNGTRTARNGGGTISRDNYALVLYDELVEGAVKAKSSDIHFYADKAPRTGSYIKLRVHGKPKTWLKNLAPELIRRILSSAFSHRLVEKTNSRATPSFDNEVSFITSNEVGKRKFEGRCNGLASSKGFKLVLRLLEDSAQVDSIPTLEELGYLPSQIAQLNMLVRRNYGLLVIFGATGSGKSTTLRTFVCKVRDPYSIEAYTLENPVEYDMPGVCQFSVPVDNNLTTEQMQLKFISTLRNFVRMDPDLIVLGEIRDKESMRAASEFTETGHPCYTTSHGDSPVDGLSRLCGQSIQLPSELLGGLRFLSAAIYQRLIPTLCTHCRIPAMDPVRGLSPEKRKLLRSKFGLDASTMFVACEEGCAHCASSVDGLDNRGREGVIVAAEVFAPSYEMRQLAAHRRWAELNVAYRRSRSTGFADGDMTGKTAYECALYHAVQGRVSITDIEEEFEPLESYEVMAGDGREKA